MANRDEEIFMQSWKRQQKGEHKFSAKRTTLKSFGNVDHDLNTTSPNYEDGGFFDEEFFEELKIAEVNRNQSLEKNIDSNIVPPPDSCEPTHQDATNLSIITSHEMTYRTSARGLEERSTNLVEDQYFGDYGEVGTPYPGSGNRSNQQKADKTAATTSHRNICEETADVLGHIDSQYFSTLDSQSSSVKTVTSSLRDSPQTNLYDAQDVYDLNYVDQQLFGIQMASPTDDEQKPVSDYINHTNSQTEDENVQQDISQQASKTTQSKHLPKVSDRHQSREYLNQQMLCSDDSLTNQKQNMVAKITSRKTGTVATTKLCKGKHAGVQNSYNGKRDEIVLDADIHQINNSPDKGVGHNIGDPERSSDIINSVDRKDCKPVATEGSSSPNNSKANKVTKQDRRGDLLLKIVVPDLTKEPSYCVVDLLIETIVYEDDRVVCLNKPYSLASQDGPGVYHSISKYLPEIAKRLKYDGALYLCHRLEKSASGVVVLAKGEAESVNIRRRFEKGEVWKSYTALTHGVPKPLAGVIDIPIATETCVKNNYRSILLPHDTKSRRHEVYSARTKYEVVKHNLTAALVELEPSTGHKHQLRVHLADGIDTPILGDHKYSHRDKLAPQWLSGDILAKFQLRACDANKMPMHLHARRLVLADYFHNGSELSLTAKLPKFFSRSIKLMKFFR